MSFKGKLFSFFMVALATAAFSTFSFAQDDKAPVTPTTGDKAERPARPDGRAFGRGDHKGFEGKRGLGERMGRRGGPMADFRGLNLTDAQKEQIKNIKESNRPDKGTMDQMKALREAHKTGTPPTAEQKAQMKAFREQAQAKAKSVRAQLFNVLTADQKAQLEKHKAEMKQRREEFQQKREEFRKNRPNKTAPAAPVKPITD